MSAVKLLKSEEPNITTGSTLCIENCTFFFKEEEFKDLKKILNPSHEGFSILCSVQYDKFSTESKYIRKFKQEKDSVIFVIIKNAVTVDQIKIWSKSRLARTIAISAKNEYSGSYFVVKLQEKVELQVKKVLSCNRKESISRGKLFSPCTDGIKVEKITNEKFFILLQEKEGYNHFLPAGIFLSQKQMKKWDKNIENVERYIKMVSEEKERKPRKK